MPPVILNKMALGANLARWTYLDTRPGPTNMIRGGTGFLIYSEPSGQTATTLDANGWPNTDFRIGPYPSGGVSGQAPYLVSFEFIGQATVQQLFAHPAVSGLTSAYNSGTNKTTGSFTFDSANNGSYPPTFQFGNTKRTSGSATGTGVTELYMWRPEDVGKRDHSWRSELVTYVQSFSTTLRMMQLMHIWDGGGPTTWASRSRDQSSYAEEDLVALANQANIDLWCQIPTFATSDWTTGFWTFIKNNLNSGLHVNLGYANETWNYGGAPPAAKDAMNLALTLVKGARGGGGYVRGINSANVASNVCTITVNYAIDITTSNHVTVAPGVETLLPP